jgi:hypothetical protein
MGKTQTKKRGGIMPRIGVGIGIPFCKNSGIDFLLYWTTRTPTALYAVVYRDTEADLTWTDPSGDVAFRVYISTDGINYVEKGTTLAGDNTYTATGLTAGTLYYFYVKAYNGANESSATNIIDTFFKITVDTTKAGSANTHFVLPVTAKSAGDYYVTWGDGSAEETFTTIGNKDHTYGASGTYTVKVRGGMTALAFAGAGDRFKLMTIDQWGNIKWAANQVSSYSGCENMQGNYLDDPNWSSVTSISQYFANCREFNYKVPFHTSSVQNMSYVFNGAYIFNQPLAWNTANVTTMFGMLGYALNYNQPISFNTGNVATMNGMLYRTDKFNQDVSGLNYEKITDTGLVSFITNVGTVYSTANYDLLLIALAAQNVNNGVTMNVEATYTPGGAAEAARLHLTATHSWTITDDGPSF